MFLSFYPSPCALSRCLQHLHYLPSLFLPLDCCLSITGHPVFTLSLHGSAWWMHVYKVLWVSAWLCDPTEFVTQVLPNPRSWFDSLFEAATQFPAAIHAPAAPLSLPGLIPPLLPITDTQKLFWNLLLYLDEYLDSIIEKLTKVNTTSKSQASATCGVTALQSEKTAWPNHIFFIKQKKPPQNPE